MDKRQLSLKIKAEAKNLGFFACGIAKAEPVEAESRGCGQGCCGFVPQMD